MRGLLVTAIIAVLLPMTFGSPYVGALLYAWVSLMNPHKLTFGFAYGMPFAMVIAMVCIATVAFTKQRRPLPNSPIVWVYLAFLFWMCVTSVFAITTPELVWQQWVNNAKIHLMIIVTILVVYEKRTLHYLIYVTVGSIAFFGAKGGVFVLLTGGGHRVWGPPQSNVEENNALGLGLVTLFPLLIWIYRQQHLKWVRIGMIACMVSVIFSILGSHSRGALLALLAMTGVLIMRSERKILYGIVLVFAIGTAVAFMPDNWGKRMDTIQEHKDGSAQARLNTWRTLFNLSLDRPILGAGFRIDNYDIYAKYSPIRDAHPFAAHSIYFQALGEHGYPGLILYLSIPILCILRCRKIVKKYQEDPEAKWAVDFCKLFPVSVAGFGAGGAFLGLVHWDFTYYLVAMVIILARMDDEGTLGGGGAQPSVATSGPKPWYEPRRRGSNVPSNDSNRPNQRPGSRPLLK